MTTEREEENQNEIEKYDFPIVEGWPPGMCFCLKVKRIQMCVINLDKQSELIIFESTLTTFEASCCEAAVTVA